MTEAAKWPPFFCRLRLSNAVYRDGTVIGAKLKFMHPCYLLSKWLELIGQNSSTLLTCSVLSGIRLLSDKKFSAIHAAAK